jgi:hypothetical protein
VISAICKPIMAASAMISAICKPRMPLLGRKKEDVEKVEREKVQRFHNLLCRKLAGLCLDMEKSVATLGGQCFEFLDTNATVGSMLDWFKIGCKRCPPPSLNLIRTLPILQWLVF